LADRYRIDRALGSGGMATVYLAHDLRHDRRVAIKVLRDELAESLGRERFLREIRLAAKLTHPHILPLYDSGEANGFLYFVMPVMEGQTLRDRLRQEGQLSVDTAIRLASEVADALDYAHRNDVVHRDIKPENILVERATGHALVTDFGIARAIEKSSDIASVTSTGLTLGTPTYMSPEQAAAERRIDGRSDIYSLGCVLYEMLGGTPPFTGTTARAIIAQHLNERPRSLRIVRPDLPAHVDDALRKSLAKSPDDRHRNGAAMCAALSGPPRRRGLFW